MLSHIGVPMEVMGLMLGDFVDDYTVRVVDVSFPCYPLLHVAHLRAIY